ncbi:superoxide dismutase [Methanocella sp. CWC-04]|uniref:Superoxide dismutase n=1 Tax=Methanooceanicella nereidis TaxID=2052831 RepID=A0AAP2REU7_9EURY|nr:superoxide dismutase family protein [Methanocella sp. CWC-04]MCD1295882.1 superoxide dismutase [Methanocella sp. CWC-04]
MKKTIFVLTILLVIAFSASAYARNEDVRQASAVLKDTNGKEVGLARFTEDESGLVRVEVNVEGLSPGLHGIHIHEVGSCSPTFAAAGGHYNPLGKKHGLSNPEGPHAGDLPNMGVNKDGKGYLNTTTDLATLSPGPTTLFDQDGSAIVIHSGPDDQISDPSGNSGDRVVCGVIKAE